MVDKSVSIASQLQPHPLDTKDSIRAKEISTLKTIAYAAPAAGGYFFYAPMWSILPGMYAKYFGLSLISIAAVILLIRLFDGVIDTTIGYLSDLHRSAGGSRKPWVLVGGLGSIMACYFLFQPPQPATTTYYLVWSMIYFLAFTIAEIPHLTWGSELTLDYQQRAKVFGVRCTVTRLGQIVFYTLPLLPLYTSSDYSPAVLRDAVYFGAIMTLCGLVWSLVAAPRGIAAKTVHEDSWRLFSDSIVSNKPLLLYFVAFGCLGLAGGMWYGLIYFYLDSYLGLGDKVAMMFLLGTIITALSTPFWLRLIEKTSKSTVWAIGALLFALQLIGALLISPATTWWIPFLLIIIANLFFNCHDIAALSILGDIVDYGKLKFHKDRGATYFGLNILIFKVGLGVGGGLALAVAGFFGFNPAIAVHTSSSILGLKLGFILLPLLFTIFGVVFILRTPINPQRHRIIQRRIESQLKRSGK